MIGLSMIGRSSFGMALVAGRNRVPRPATGKTAVVTGAVVLSAVETLTREHPWETQREWIAGQEPTRGSARGAAPT
jgi:hypothetical protein